MEHLWFGSNMTMCLLGVDLQGRVRGFSSQLLLHTCSLSTEGFSFPVPPAYGPDLGSLREAVLLCGITSKAGAPGGELWWVKASLQLGPTAAHQLLQLAWAGKRGRSRAHSLTAGLGLPWQVNQLTCWYFWGVTAGRGGQGGWGRGPLFQVALCHLS